MAIATRTRTSFALVRRSAPLVDIEGLARDAGLHPGLVRRLVALGLVEPRGGTRAAPLFTRDEAAPLARAARLRRDLGLNYAGAVLATELLARIDDLEEQLAHYAPTRRHEVMTWTRTV
jgi:chaperone modulatory protein CbpM